MTEKQRVVRHIPIGCDLWEGNISWMSNRDYTSLEGTKDPSPHPLPPARIHPAVREQWILRSAHTTPQDKIT